MSELKFGRSGRDITKVIEKAINIAAVKAMDRDIWYKTNVVIPGQTKTKKQSRKKTMLISIVNPELIEDKNSIIVKKDEKKDKKRSVLDFNERKRAFNFIICKNDIKKAMIEVTSSLNEELYIELLLRMGKDPTHL